MTTGTSRGAPLGHWIRVKKSAEDGNRLWYLEILSIDSSKAHGHCLHDNGHVTTCVDVPRSLPRRLELATLGPKYRALLVICVFLNQIRCDSYRFDSSLTAQSEQLGPNRQT